MKLIGSVSSHWLSFSAASKTKAEAFADAINASREISIRFGIPVEPDVSTIRATSSETFSGKPCASGILPFTSGAVTKTAHFPSSTSAKATRAPKVSFAAISFSGLDMQLTRRAKDKETSPVRAFARTNRGPQLLRRFRRQVEWLRRQKAADQRARHQPC
ncbi:unannotated protein [freshwater metagenome]|uniref:Unannotated protein n=1 Tax=freshwater metagenome TaxID=449393 RepID=A0A6J6DBC7_9ZZZZ